MKNSDKFYEANQPLNVLMVGVDSKRVGGMWTVAETYIKNEKFNQKVHLTYIPTMTAGSVLKRSLFMLKGYCRVLWRLCTCRTDIVHIHMAEKGSTFRKGLIAKWGNRAGKKVVIHLHAGPFMDWYMAQSVRNQRMIRKIFTYAHKVCVLGEYWKTALSSIVSPDKIEVLYNGVRCPSGNLYSEQSRNIVYLGVMRRAKGIYDLLDAMEHINTELDPRITLLLCGIDMEGNVADLIRRKGLENRVKLMGWIDEERREQVLSDAMLVVLPSYFEGLSMTVLEAMAHGIPVVTTNISTMPELLGQDILLITPGDVCRLEEYLLKLVNDTAQRFSMSAIEFERVNQYFSEDAFIDKTLEIYRRSFG